MICFVGLDDTDSSRGYCTTYLAYRIASDLSSDLRVLPYPRLVRLNPNIPFKTRGNAAVCLLVETNDPERAFERICSTATKFSDAEGGANSGLVFFEGKELIPRLEPVYLDALYGVVNVHRVTSLLRECGVRFWTQGNGMGLIGATCSLAFDERFDHTYELISYRRNENWGRPRVIDASSIREMDRRTFPHTFNNYDYQKRRILIAPHGPDPVFAGIRGDSPRVVSTAFGMIAHEEELDGHMIYLSNQHTDAHLAKEQNWKVFTSGWVTGKVDGIEVGPGGHVYVSLHSGRERHLCAVYEPTGDLRRMAKALQKGDMIKAYGGVRKPTAVHRKVLNVERIDVLSLARGAAGRCLVPGSFVASPRANRHLTKPLIRYGREASGQKFEEVEGWLNNEVIPTRALARSR
ncbi:MAG: tRNA(Ile)(2)-agmatinylcytidine synthase [Nitrososphaerales archaeon]|nr:tRNA(Ile)(2)-agmatinylcytidine synthase [Nitrososphaerales archaeon]